MIAPEGPTGGPIRQAVLDDQPDSHVDDAPGVRAAGRGQVGHVGVEVLAAAGATVLGVEQDEFAGPPGHRLAQVVERSPHPAVAVGALAAPRAGPAAVVAAADADPGSGQVFDAGDAPGGVGAIFAGSWHGGLLKRRDLPGNTPGDG